MLSLYSSAFGSYAATLISITGDPVLDKHILISGVILFSAFIILTVQQTNQNPLGIIIAFGIFLSCFIGEWIFKANKNKISGNLKEK